VRSEICQPTVSVVIPAHNEGSRLHLTLEAIHETVSVPHEVVVVDDGSDDGATDYVLANQSLFGNVCVVRQSRTGPAGARNLGADHAAGEILVFLDAHCFPGPRWLEGLLEQLHQNPNAMVMPVITVAGDSRTKMYGLDLRADLSMAWILERPPGVSEVPIAPGCCLAMTSQLFHRLGGFDRMRIYGLEDVELSLRAWLCGHPVVINPTVEVAHVTKQHGWDEVTFDAYVYNLLRMALVHLDAASNRALLRPLQGLPSYRRAMTQLDSPEFWDWYDRANRMKQHGFEWFCRRFASHDSEA